jgi:putative SOS response-associated peptidase YedK
MCGRYTLTRQEGVIEEMQAVLGMALAPRFNIAPTQPAPVAFVRHGTRQIEMMRWGLVPHVPKPGAKKLPLMINARVESIMDKAVYRDAFARRRCLVPADGFFEWKREHKTPLPVYFRPEPRRVFAFAGIWTWSGEAASFAILTGPPNALVAPIHDRMPIVLDRAAYDAWLDPDVDAAAARALLHEPEIGDWRADFVSTRVNAAAHDDPGCIAPAEAPAQRELF